MKWTPIQYFIPDIDGRYFLRVVENGEVMLVPAIYSGTYRSYMNVNNFYISEETITHILPYDPENIPDPTLAYTELTTSEILEHLKDDFITAGFSTSEVANIIDKVIERYKIG